MIQLRGLFRGSAMALLVLVNTEFGRAEPVEVLRVPAGALQPQAEVSDGIVHVIYFRGEPAGGNIFYMRKAVEGSAFSEPIQVNTQPGSAIAVGTIRGAQLAVGRGGRVHVVWNGGKGAAKVKVGGKEQTPLLYTRLNDAGTGFEAERNLLTAVGGLDGGSSVAADPAGRVYVTWHGSSADNKRGEAGRGVYLAQSKDDGRTFEPEKEVAGINRGACGCCGMRTFADSRGAVYMTYRAADKGLERDELFLVSPEPGAQFHVALTSPWRASTCPMSSTTLTPASSGALASWETDGQVFFATIDGTTMKATSPISPERGPKKKHPVAVANRAGEVLLVWTEGTAWAKGGSVHWQRFDATGKPVGKPGRAEGLPAWSLATAYAKPNGEFAVIY